MQRDFGNEVIVAIVAVSVLAFALTFGIIISLSNSNAGTIAQSNVATDAPVATLTVTITVTNEQTEEATVTTEASPTREPTATNEPSATATATTTPEPTATTEPSATRTSTRTSTATNEPTRTLTRTRRPSRTPQPTATATMTATITTSPTPTSSATNTPRPTQTATATRTLTATPKPTLSASPKTDSSPTPTIESICIAPFGWVAYEVQDGDSLISIAQSIGSTLDALREANCLVSIDQIQPGDQLSVPRLPAEAPSGNELEAQGCTDPSTQITSPVPGARVRLSFILVGTATLENFSYYQIEIRADTTNVFNFYSRSVNPVVDGVLGAVELRNYDPGLHWVRLSVVDDSGLVNTRPCAIPMFFE